jgi:hypothetical protein
MTKMDASDQLVKVSQKRRLDHCSYCGSSWRFHEIQQDKDRDGIRLIAIFHCSKCGARKFEPHPGMEWDARLVRLHDEIYQLQVALDESVKLQSHYAGILNDYDGGKRVQFANREEWIDRLIVTKR